MIKNSLIYSQLEAEAKSENTSDDRLWELAQQDDNLALIVAQNTIDILSDRIITKLAFCIKNKIYI
ncbi:MAG: hypothetical protein ACRC80_38090 [Waterburya sp.]